MSSAKRPKAGPSEDLKIRGCQYHLVGISAPLVGIGLTDLQKSGGVMAPPAPPGTTSLQGIGKKKVQRIYLPKGLGGSIGHVKVNWIFLTLRCQKSFQFS